MIVADVKLRTKNMLRITDSANLSWLLEKLAIQAK